MSLYVFLRDGRRASLGEMQWPPPLENEAGAWIDTPPDSIRAYPREALPWWLDDELWEAELEGDLRDQGHTVVATRGRLLKRVEEWTPAVAAELLEACAFRVRDAGAEALAQAGRAPEAGELAGCGSLEELQRIGSTTAEFGSDPASRLAGFAADAVLYARDATSPARAAAVAAYVAAHALAGGDKSLAGYEANFAAERRWQAGWLSRRLGLERQ